MDEDIYPERWTEKEARQMFDSSEGKKAFQNVFEKSTQETLLKMADEKIITKLYGTIESGKESVVFLADDNEGNRVLVKIYMTRAGGFRNMMQYLQGDKRFRNIKKDRRSIIYEWCKKEFRNLKEAKEVLKCPEPIATRKNILVMDFIGKEFSPYPKIKDVEIENPEKGFEIIKNQYKRLWNQKEIVHGDLSEYNILVNNKGEMFWIDFSQGVHKSHPQAEELLERDIKTIGKFFEKKGAEIDIEKACEAIISGD